jgi:alpha-galactosidase
MMRTAVLVAAACLAPAAAYDNGAPHSRLPALGWSSWVALGPGDEHPVFDYCDENSVKAAADAFMEVGLYEAGYRHLHLDDCWAAKERNATGFPYPEIDHFPNGMKPVIDYVHAKGDEGDKLVFGLYTCGGTKTCVGGRVGSENHWTQDAQAYAEWGVDWVKMDWCNSAPQDPKETYPKMGKALNESGRHIAFNMCEWGKENPWEWGDACAQSWRATGDHTGTWSSTKGIISQVRSERKHNGK